ncbi:mannose-1-phosphate guanylyltransferase/mannose-6-phosphate isomerase [Candidatus Phycosocius bacilliformis]|uniref:mannose-1-phosphate guanylyltransferase/mannose-6-phosphate isomerase n=1 Tax=Candidatus Phycosocius bacilliformis TaxID=1445552 RepID=UPI001788B95D|nr:mannose-1-phosphate guanylyltransferase/mannose-6-phosphate isomerase [Candidatus Phycosocius bacilliformis]
MPKASPPLITPVILSGGAGSRLWPLSTETRPKQFHALLGKSTMFGQTLQRVGRQEAIAFGDPIVICSLNHLASVREELQREHVPDATIILEPCPRNTAPALSVTALIQAERDPDSLLLVMPADHIIDYPDRLYQACLDACQAAEAGHIVTFGIPPTAPETGFGYIKTGDELAQRVFAVDAFKEKPDKQTAEGYLADGAYVWNAGIFLFKASSFVAEMAKHAPEILDAARATLSASQTEAGCVFLNETRFAQVPASSVDYAVMERTHQAAVVPVDMGWHDVGSFLTLWEMAEKDGEGNVVQGPVALFDSANCLVRTEAVAVSLIGVNDLVVIATEQGILVTHKDRAQDVRLAADAFKPKSPNA